MSLMIVVQPTLNQFSVFQTEFVSFKLEIFLQSLIVYVADS